MHDLRQREATLSNYNVVIIHEDPVSARSRRAGQLRRNNDLHVTDYRAKFNSCTSNSISVHGGTRLHLLWTPLRWDNQNLIYICPNAAFFWRRKICPTLLTVHWVTLFRYSQHCIALSYSVSGKATQAAVRMTQHRTSHTKHRNIEALKTP